MRSRRRTALVTTLALGLGSLGLVACSSDSDTASGGTDVLTSEAAPAETTAAAAGETATTQAAAEGGATTVAADAPSTTMGTAEKNNIFFMAVGAGNFLTLAKLLTSAELLDTIKGPGPFTVFAPTDAAFAKVPAETLQAVAADKAKLQKVLLYHVVPATS